MKTSNQILSGFPERDNLILSLLLAELKSRKLSILLHQLGVEEQCSWLPSLSEPIAVALELETDEQFREFDRLMDQYVKEIDDPADSKMVANKLMVKFQK